MQPRRADLMSRSEPELKELGAAAEGGRPSVADAGLCPDREFLQCRGDTSDGRQRLPCQALGDSRR